MNPCKILSIVDVTADEIGPVCLVTGGSGFLGRALCRALAAIGCEVRSFDVRPLRETPAGVTSIVGDVCDPDAVRRAASECATVFHAAAVMCFLGVCRPSTRREVERVNVGGTVNVIEACRRVGVRRLVYTSTDSVCYRPNGVMGGDETLAYADRCLDIYAETKINAEREVIAADGRGNLRTVALRPAGLWGDDEECYMITKLVSQLYRGRFVATVGDGTALADNTHVDNLVLAEILAAKKLAAEPDRVGGRAYFITDEEPMNLVEWFRPLIEGLGFRVPRRAVPARLMYAAAYLMEWIHRLGGPAPVMTRLEVHNLTTTFTFRCDRAREDLGYRPIIGRDEGMKRCVAFFRSRIPHPGCEQ